MKNNFILTILLLFLSQVLIGQTIIYYPPKGIVETKYSPTDNIYNYQDTLGIISIQIKLISNRNFYNFKETFNQEKFFFDNQLVPMLKNFDFTISNKTGILLKGYIEVLHNEQIIEIVRTTFFTGDSNNIVIFTAAYPKEIDEIFYSPLLESLRSLELKN